VECKCGLDSWSEFDGLSMQGMTEEARSNMYKARTERSLLQRVATADEIAEGEHPSRNFVVV
jgi:hypothetical protein